MAQTITISASTLLPDITAPLAEDADTAPVGWSRVSSTTLNVPVNSNGSFLLTLKWDAAAKSQIFIDRADNHLFVRKRQTSGWSAWRNNATNAIVSGGGYNRLAFNLLYTDTERRRVA